jgi:hypothetical protein
MGDSPDTRRTLAVVPLSPGQRYYGEAPVRLRRGPRDARLPGLEVQRASGSAVWGGKRRMRGNHA